MDDPTIDHLLESDLTKGDLTEDDLTEDNLTKRNSFESDPTKGDLTKSDLIKGGDTSEGDLTSFGVGCLFERQATSLGAKASLGLLGWRALGNLFGLWASGDL